MIEHLKNNGFWMLFIFAFLGGIVSAALWAGGQARLEVLPPCSVPGSCEQYCQGWTDGAANILIDSKQITMRDYGEQGPLVYAACLKDVHLMEPIFTAPFAGPIEPGEKPNE